MKIFGLQLFLSRKRNSYINVFAASVLAAFMTVSPVISFVHVAFATHQHRFNPLTGHYEDVIVLNFEQDAAPNADEKGNAALCVERAFVNYAECALSNFCLLRDVVLSHQVTALDVSVRNNESILSQQVLVASYSILSAAPKQSPPFVS